MLLDAFERLLDGFSAPSQVRAIEAGQDIDTMWPALEESGFLDALVPEEMGGAGLALQEVGPLVIALGSHLTPAPVAQTMTARGLLTRGGVNPPRGPIVFAVMANGTAHGVAHGQMASHLLIDTGGEIVLVTSGAATITSVPGLAASAADIAWHATGAIASIPRPDGGLTVLAAALNVAAMAGACGRILGMTIEHANARHQFGKPIGKQQAVQQQLSVMAEKVVMVRMAAQIACSAALVPTFEAAAVAKSVASAAVVDIAAIAHAVHGAIGVSEEHDLQLFTRQLHGWRIADGSESWWSAMLGEARLSSDIATSVDFLRTVAAAPPDCAGARPGTADA